MIFQGRTILGRILFLYGIWACAPVIAGTPGHPEAVPAPVAFDPLSTSYLFKMMLSLFLVLVLMFVVVWLMKRTGRFAGRAGNYPLRVLTQLSVGTRERVLLVAVGDRQMLLGVTNGQIEALGWVDPPIAPEERQSFSSSGGADHPFARLLQNQVGNRRQPADPVIDPPPAAQNEKPVPSSEPRS